MGTNPSIPTERLQNGVTEAVPVKEKWARREENDVARYSIASEAAEKAVGFAAIHAYCDSQGSKVPICQTCPSGSLQENALPPWSFASRSITILAPAILALA